jgi:hypothetical protein
MFISSDTAAAVPMLSINYNPSGNNDNALSVHNCAFIGSTTGAVIDVERISRSPHAFDGVLVVQTGDGDGILWQGVYESAIEGCDIYKASGGTAGSVGLAFQNLVAVTDGSQITIRNTASHAFEHPIELGYPDYNGALGTGKFVLENVTMSSTTVGGTTSALGLRIGGRAAAVSVNACNIEGDMATGIQIGEAAKNVTIRNSTISYTGTGVIVGQGVASTSGINLAQSAVGVNIDNNQFTARGNNSIGVIVNRDDPVLTNLHHISIGKNNRFMLGTITGGGTPTGTIGISVKSPTYGLDIDRNYYNTPTTVDYPQFAQNYATENTGWSMIGMTVSRIFNTVSGSVNVAKFLTGDRVISPAPGSIADRVCTALADGSVSEAGTATAGSGTITDMGDTSDITVGYVYAPSAQFTAGDYYAIAKTSTSVTLNAVATGSGAVTITERLPTWQGLYTITGTAATGAIPTVNASGQLVFVVP